MKLTIFVVGPSDLEGQSWTRLNRIGEGVVEAEYRWSGVQSCLRDFVRNDPRLEANSVFFYIGIQKRISVPKNASFNLFNLVCEPDASRVSLEAVRNVESALRPDRCFNPVDSVLLTSRTKLYRSLSNIDGCRVPLVQEAHPKTLEEFKAYCKAFKRWPLIVRARGYHGGGRMVLLENPSQIESIGEERWLYEGIYLIEFFDYKNADGLYQKTRIMLVDKQPYPRHSIFSDHWKIHTRSRSRLMDSQIELREKEAKQLEYLSETRLGEYSSVFKAIGEPIDLDVFGVDCALVNGEVVVFEVNACMDFLSQDYGKDQQYRYLDPHIRRLRRAVKRMLMNG